MFGGLHIEMAALKILGDWLDGSGWVQVLVQAEITTLGTADSFQRAPCTRQAHQVTAAALYILQHLPLSATVREKLQRQMISSSLKTGATREKTSLS